MTFASARSNREHGPSIRATGSRGRLARLPARSAFAVAPESCQRVGRQSDGLLLLEVLLDVGIVVDLSVVYCRDFTQ